MTKTKMQGGLKGFLIKPPFIKRLLLMLIGVIVMGICVSVLKLTHFGTDPCSATNYGLCKLTGLSFGTIQVITATLYFLIVICFDYSKLGLGTLGNMFVVGYVADFTTYFTNDVLGITDIDSFFVRFVVMIVNSCSSYRFVSKSMTGVTTFPKSITSCGSVPRSSMPSMSF